VLFEVVPSDGRWQLLRITTIECRHQSIPVEIIQTAGSLQNRFSLGDGDMEGLNWTAEWVLPIYCESAVNRADSAINKAAIYQRRFSYYSAGCPAGTSSYE
jgi:hypothetical protein